jgi:hypothetical protein
MASLSTKWCYQVKPELEPQPKSLWPTCSPPSEQISGGLVRTPPPPYLMAVPNAPCGGPRPSFGRTMVEGWGKVVKDLPRSDPNLVIFHNNFGVTFFILLSTQLDFTAYCSSLVNQFDPRLGVLSVTASGPPVGLYTAHWPHPSPRPRPGPAHQPQPGIPSRSPS